MKKRLTAGRATCGWKHCSHGCGALPTDDPFVLPAPHYIWLLPGQESSEDHLVLSLPFPTSGMLLAITVNSLHTSPHMGLGFRVLDAPPVLSSAFLSHCCGKEWGSQSAPSLDSCPPDVFCVCRGCSYHCLCWQRALLWLPLCVCARVCMNICPPISARSGRGREAPARVPRQD